SPASPHHPALDRLNDRIHGLSAKARERVEGTDFSRPNRPVEQTDQREDDGDGEQRGTQYLGDCLHADDEAVHYCRLGVMCSSFTRNANLSAVSSICLVVGLPAPCPALVSILTRIGLAHD